MDEYISKEKAIKELREVYENEYPTASGDFDEYASHDVPNVLRNIPSAGVQPVRRGKWIGDEVIQCSICNFTLNGNAFERIVRKYFKYCPNCGARMDGDTE